MNELLQVLSMLAIPTGVLLTCRYFNRRAEPTRAVGRRDSDGRDVF